MVCKVSETVVSPTTGQRGSKGSRPDDPRREEALPQAEGRPGRPRDRSSCRELRPRRCPRDVVSQEGLDPGIEEPHTPFAEEPTDWSRRYKANLEELASGDVIKVAEVVGDLWRVTRTTACPPARSACSPRPVDPGLRARARREDRRGEGRRHPRRGPRVLTPGPGPLGTDVTDADAAPCSVGVVVVAAGSGTRLAAGLPKAFVPLRGRPLLGYAVDTVCAAARVGLPGRRRPSRVRRPLRDTLGRHRPPAGCRGRRSEARRAPTRWPPGWPRWGDVDVVLVHDAARCLTPLAVFERVVEAVRAGAAGAVPGIPLVDTVKTVDAHGVITGTPDRASLRAVQTRRGSLGRCSWRPTPVGWRRPTTPRSSSWAGTRWSSSRATSWRSR